MITNATTVDAMHKHIVIPKKIRSLAISLTNQVSAPKKNRKFSVSHGASLYALFLKEMSAFLNDPILNEVAIEHMLVGAKLLEDDPLSTSMYKSVTGYAWVLNFLNTQRSMAWAEELLSDIDEILLDAFTKAGDTLNIDLINGVAGLLVYALARAKTTGDLKLIMALDDWFKRRFDYWKNGYGACQKFRVRAG